MDIYIVTLLIVAYLWFVSSSLKKSVIAGGSPANFGKLGIFSTEIFYVSFAVVIHIVIVAALFDLVLTLLLSPFSKKK